MGFGNVVEMTMAWCINQVLDNPDTPEKITDMEIEIGLHAGFNEVIILSIYDWTAAVESFDLEWWEVVKKHTNASIETDFDTFWALGLNRINSLKFAWLMIRKKIKVTGILKLLKFKKLIKLVNGGKKK